MLRVGRLFLLSSRPRTAFGFVGLGVAVVVLVSQSVDL